MGRKVREVKPLSDTSGLDELVAEELPAAAASAPGGNAPAGRKGEPGPIVVHLLEHRHPLTASDLGPNGDVVLELLSRAARLTADECRRLEKDARWRWGFLAMVPAGLIMPVARAVALVRGGGDNRSDAIVALEAEVAAIMRDWSRKRTRSLLSTCISNAGLAVLTRDLIDAETFEVLFGPWREVMHH
jgi:hypothetical protein